MKNLEGDTLESREKMAELLKKYNKLKGKVGENEQFRKESSSCSVYEYKKMEEELKEMKKKVNSLTDDIFTVQGHMSSNFNIIRKDFNKSFGIEDEMDYF